MITFLRSLIAIGIHNFIYWVIFSALVYIFILGTHRALFLRKPSNKLQVLFIGSSLILGLLVVFEIAKLMSDLLHQRVLGP